jgi:hypothetical protein
MWAKQYIDSHDGDMDYLNCHDDATCPECGRLLYIDLQPPKTFPGKSITTAFRTPGWKHVEYFMLKCVNHHYFIQASHRNKYNLYMIMCDEDFDWHNYQMMIGEYFHKYSLPDRLRMRMYQSMVESNDEKHYRTSKGARAGTTLPLRAKRRRLR